MNVRVLLGQVLAVVAGWGACLFGQEAASQEPDTKVLRVRQTDDFVVNGKGDAPAWTKTAWEPLHLRTANGHRYQTRVKVLYSRTGLYVLMDAEDRTITATMKEDFLDLWTEDVFEFFLWPDGRKTGQRQAIYFEYEVSPLGFELPILIPNFGGEFLGCGHGTTRGSGRYRKPPPSPAAQSGRGPAYRVGRPRCLCRTICSSRCKTFPRNPARDGGPTSIASTTTPARRLVGTGPASEKAFTSSTNSVRSS